MSDRESKTTTVKKFSRSTDYHIQIAIGLDLKRIEMGDDGVVHFGDRATIPPLLEAYAERQGHTMPDGLYGFFGEAGDLALKKQIDYDLSLHKGEGAPIFDMSADITLQWDDRDEPRPRATTMIWKSPEHLKGAFLRVGRISAETNNILRFYTGDRRAIDRLTLEPWRIDDYVGALKVKYGEIKMVIFDALMDNGDIETVAKVYDRSVFDSEDVAPMMRHVSSLAPALPKAFRIPGEKWEGWQPAAYCLEPMDRADIVSFANVPKSDKRARNLLMARRQRTLHAAGRFLPKEAAIKEIAGRRMKATIPQSSSEMGIEDIVHPSGSHLAEETG